MFLTNPFKYDENIIYDIYGIDFEIHPVFLN